MTRKRYKRLLEAAGILRNAFEELPSPPGEKKKHYGIYWDRDKTAGFGVSKQFYDTLCWVEENLCNATRNGFVK